MKKFVRSLLYFNRPHLDYLKYLQSTFSNELIDIFISFDPSQKHGTPFCYVSISVKIFHFSSQFLLLKNVDFILILLCTFC